MDGDKFATFINTEEGKRLMNGVGDALQSVLQPHIDNDDHIRFCTCLYKMAQLGRLSEVTLGTFDVNVIVEKKSDEQVDTEE